MVCNHKHCCLLFRLHSLIIVLVSELRIEQQLTNRCGRTSLPTFPGSRLPENCCFVADCETKQRSSSGYDMFILLTIDLFGNHDLSICQNGYQIFVKLAAGVAGGDMSRLVQQPRPLASESLVINRRQKQVYKQNNLRRGFIDSWTAQGMQEEGNDHLHATYLSEPR